MTNAVRYALAFAGLPVLAVTPWLWWWAPGLLFVACPALLAWALWLVVAYLQWARRLGK